MKKMFIIKCKFCGNTDKKEFQTTMECDNGYSNYTVMEDGYLEIKCIKCGTFASSDYDKEKLNSNKKDMINLICPECHKSNSVDDFISGDVDGYDPNEIECSHCKYSWKEE